MKRDQRKLQIILWVSRSFLINCQVINSSSHIIQLILLRRTVKVKKKLPRKRINLQNIRSIHHISFVTPWNRRDLEITQKRASFPYHRAVASTDWAMIASSCSQRMTHIQQIETASYFSLFYFSVSQVDVTIFFSGYHHVSIEMWDDFITWS